MKAANDIYSLKNIKIETKHPFWAYSFICDRSKSSRLEKLLSKCCEQILPTLLAKPWLSAVITFGCSGMQGNLSKLFVNNNNKYHAARTTGIILGGGQCSPLLKIFNDRIGKIFLFVSNDHGRRLTRQSLTRCTDYLLHRRPSDRHGYIGLFGRIFGHSPQPNPALFYCLSKKCGFSLFSDPTLAHVLIGIELNEWKILFTWRPTLLPTHPSSNLPQLFNSASITITLYQTDGASSKQQ